MKKYFKYGWYVIQHKYNVGIECIKMGMFWHAITHDLSKFLPSEFIPYAKFFYGCDRYNNYKKSDENNSNFQRGWMFHQKRNKHHWCYWVCLIETNYEDMATVAIPMPKKYVKQMVADWRGMSRKFGGTAKQYFMDNVNKMLLHPETKHLIVKVLFKD